MLRITILNRTTKTVGKIKIRFRLTDGRAIQLYHKSNIEIDIKMLDKLTPTGEKKPRAVIDAKLIDAIQKEISAMKTAYEIMCNDGLAINGDVFERNIEQILHPNRLEKKEKTTFLEDFQNYVAENYRNGVIGLGRKKHYDVTERELNRFLIMNGISDISTSAITSDFLLNYRIFLQNEYKYVGKWAGLYVGIKEQNLPKKPRSQNTIATKLTLLQSFFNYMEDEEKINKSPFKSLGKNRKKTILSETYNKPISLNIDDFELIFKSNVPKRLQETKDAFLVQCCLGCRIADFQKLNRSNIAVTEDGIPYVRYTPQKTAKSHEEVTTPLIDTALEIWKKYNFRFSVLNAPCGANGYNHKIKELFAVVGLNREIMVFNEELNTNEYKPISELASSKLARKTYVTIMAKAQINAYAAGLHKQGSTAVNHYYQSDIRDRFLLALAAFNRPFFTADKDLNIIR